MSKLRDILQANVGHDAGRGRPDRAGRPGRAVAAGDRLAGGGTHAGYGFPSDFSLPAVGLLFSELKQGPPQPQAIPAPDEWMAALSRIPLLHQPGEAWLYAATA
jgi:hypothetical protein